MRKICSILMLVLAAVMLSLLGKDVQTADAKSVKASVAAKKLSVGKQLTIQAKTGQVHYQSSDSTIASVSSAGVVTGKKAGDVTITVKRSGYQPKKISLEVKAVKRKPSLDVALDEVVLQSATMKKTGDHSYQYSAVVKNMAKSGKVAKIEYYYRIQVQEAVHTAGAVGTSNVDSGQSGLSDSQAETAQETQMPVATPTAEPQTIWQTTNKTVVLTAKNIGARKKSARISCEGDASGKISAMHLTKICLYTGEAAYTYQVSAKKGTLKWSNVDLTGPVISGWVGKKSFYNGEPIWICYSDRKDSYDFKENVKAVDARDGQVPVTVDTSKIKWNKEGIYKVYYTAKDKAGNCTKAWAKVQVYKPGEAERIADILLSTKAKSGSDVQKLRNIYNYVQGNCSYTGTGSHTNWRTTAAKGIRSHSGDCFTYYSIAKLLIVRAGFHHIMVRRYPERAGSNHWWNLVYVKGGWYHFDTTPRARKGYFCLQTDEQLRMYSTGSTFRFREELYPERAKKKISRNPI